MEFELKDLDKAVYYYLTTNPDVSFTPIDIFEGIMKDKICPDLSMGNTDYIKVTNICMNLQSLYTNVIYDEKMNTCKFTTKSNSNLKIIEEFVENPEMYPEINLQNLYDGENTILHVVCKECRLDLMQKITQKFYVDFDVKNKKGQHMIDMIPTNQKGVDMLKYINKVMMDQNNDKMNSENLNLKKSNTQLLEHNTQMLADNTYMTKKMSFITWCISIQTFLVILFIAYLCAF